MGAGWAALVARQSRDPPPGGRRGSHNPSALGPRRRADPWACGRRSRADLPPRQACRSAGGMGLRACSRSTLPGRLLRGGSAPRGGRRAARTRRRGGRGRPGARGRKTGGHTPGHQLIIFRHSDELSCAVTGDLVAQRPHLRLPWIPAADLDVRRSLEEKAKLLAEASSHRWLLVLGHETEHPAGYLEPGGGWTPEPELDNP